MPHFLRKYEAPEIEIKKFSTEDIMLISTSRDPDDNDVTDPFDL